MSTVAWLWIDLEQKPAILCSPGRKYTPAVYLDSSAGVRIEQIDKHVAKGLPPVMKGNRPYPVARAARKYLQSGSQFGITDRARELLKSTLDKEQS